jgi:hypothetical protein
MDDLELSIREILDIDCAKRAKGACQVLAGLASALTTLLSSALTCQRALLPRALLPSAHIRTALLVRYPLRAGQQTRIAATYLAPVCGLRLLALMEFAAKFLYQLDRSGALH